VGSGGGKGIELRPGAGRRVGRARVGKGWARRGVATPRDTQRAHQVSRAVAPRLVVHEPKLAQRRAAAHAGGEVAYSVLSSAAPAGVVGWGWGESGLAAAVWCGWRSGGVEWCSQLPRHLPPLCLPPLLLLPLPLPRLPYPYKCRSQAHRCSARVRSCAAW
jgi:hypothetical protein